MGLFDKLTGTTYPADGVAPVSAEEVRTALLGLNRPDVPYVIREGAAGDAADLVAQWRMAEPAWQTLFVESQLTRAVRIGLRLVQKGHEVRALEESWEVTRVGNPPRLKTAGAYSRGPDRTVTRHLRIQRDENGRLGATETFRFDSSELRNPCGTPSSNRAGPGAGWYSAGCEARAAPPRRLDARPGRLIDLPKRSVLAMPATPGIRHLRPG